MQPLGREVRDQRLRARVTQHSSHLTFQFATIVQRSCHRAVEQLIVRDTAPEEERQPGRQGQVADAVAAANWHIRRSDLASINEFRIREQTTGTPAAIASSSTMPKLSWPVFGAQKMSADAK